MILPVLIHRRSPQKSIVGTIPIGRRFSKSLIRTNPMDRQAPKSIVQTIPDGGQSPISTAHVLPTITVYVYHVQAIRIRTKGRRFSKVEFPELEITHDVFHIRLE